MPENNPEYETDVARLKQIFETLSRNPAVMSVMDTELKHRFQMVQIGLIGSTPTEMIEEANEIIQTVKALLGKK